MSKHQVKLDKNNVKRTRKPLNDNWYFSLADREDNKAVNYDHSEWDKLNLPHDWSMDFGYDKNHPTTTQGGFVKTGTGWYRKVIFVDESMCDKRVCIEFDGVFMNSDVYVNGHHLGRYPYGYTSFSYEISDYLSQGVNIIAVRIDCEKQPASRWYNGCGIYRHVWLTVSEKIYVDTWGTYIRTENVDSQNATVLIDTNIINSLQDTSAEIVHTIIDENDCEVSSHSFWESINKGETTVAHSFEVAKPKLWALDSPHLYKCKTQIIVAGNIIDEYVTTFGIRKIEYIADKGFFLNGENLKFKGVCLHHDAGVVGAAVPNCVIEKRLRLLKDMGCNAVRTAHNPFAPEFYDLCDKLGIMVMDEMFDGWDEVKAPYDYGLYFEERHEKDITDFLMRDRNHPSIVMWSIGNEVTNMKTEITKKLQDIVHRVDPTRPVTCGVNGASDMAEENRAILDIAGYNDGGGACFLYDKDHKTRPQQLMVATEAPHTYQTRGFYRTLTWWRDKNLPRIEIDNLCNEELFFDGHLKYKSSYDNSGVRTSVRDSWSLSEERPFLLGEFRWTGFDYHGECFGWPARWNDHGVIGMENYPKDSFYLYQSMWTDEPMVHMLPHWTHIDMEIGTKIPVWVYTNCDAAEVLLNGTSQGRKTRHDAKFMQWDVPYEKGEIKVFAYNDGEVMAEKSFRTAGVPSTIKVDTDYKETRITNMDTIQIDASICDNNGEMVPHGENNIYFNAFGDLSILGTENGDCVDTTPVRSSKRKAFYGRCMSLAKKHKHQKHDSSEIFVASLLGDVIFLDTTEVSVDFKRICLEDSDDKHRYYVNMRINEQDWFRYTESITIDKTTNVEVEIYCDDKPLFYMENVFTKGEKEKVVDLIHGNKVLNLEHPIGPFDEKMCGIWSDGEFDYDFKSNGTVVRMLGESQEQKIGFWWYDYPHDTFEDKEYAGQGEIWYDSGERSKIHMTTQQAKELILDNSNGAMGATFWFEEQVKLYKK